jgi:hypothetical protein
MNLQKHSEPSVHNNQISFIELVGVVTVSIFHEHTYYAYCLGATITAMFMQTTNRFWKLSRLVLKKLDLVQGPPFLLRKKVNTHSHQI